MYTPPPLILWGVPYYFASPILTRLGPTEALHPLAVPAECLGETVPRPARCPAAAGSPPDPGSVHTPGTRKDTVPEPVPVEVPVPVLPCAAAAAAVAARSLPQPPGTTVPMLPSSLPGSAVAAVDREPDPQLAAAEYTTPVVHKLPALVEEAAVE